MSYTLYKRTVPISFTSVNLPGNIMVDALGINISPRILLTVSGGVLKVVSSAITEGGHTLNMTGMVAANATIADFLNNISNGQVFESATVCGKVLHKITCVAANTTRDQMDKCVVNGSLVFRFCWITDVV